MAWEQAAYDGLQDASIDTVAYLPDSFVSPLIDLVEDDPAIDTIRVTREESAVSILAGTWLGGSRGALVCQSSGLANAFNALGSHTVPGGLPFVGLVTRRGDLGDHNGAQVPAGYGMPRMLDAIGVRNRHLEPADDAREVVAAACETSFSTHSPYVLLLASTLRGEE
ncbi:MAG: hypothetical protein ABEH64_04115 [Salinirussus sp.]